MKLDEKQVLHSRWPFWRVWREKEWYFSCLHDPGAKIYFSWAFVRTYATDGFRFWWVDLGSDQTWSVDHRLYLEPGQAPERLDLRGGRPGYAVAFQGVDGQPDRARLVYQDHRFQIDLEILRRHPPFTRRDHTFENTYSLLHHVGNEARGTLTVDGRAHPIHTRRCYTDHCAGRVPRRTGWQWIAVQSDDVAVASLVNRGPDAQRYTQIYLDGRWVRLAEEVSFQYTPQDLSAPWQVTSVDMDLVVRPRRVHLDHVAVPPGLPLLYNVHHNELFVEVDGRVRIDGTWRDVTGLTGVAEEHHGVW